MTSIEDGDSSERGGPSHPKPWGGRLTGDGEPRPFSLAGRRKEEPIETPPDECPTIEYGNQTSQGIKRLRLLPPKGDNRPSGHEP